MLERADLRHADPETLAELSRGDAAQKIPALREALEGRFTATTR